MRSLIAVLFMAELMWARTPGPWTENDPLAFDFVVIGGGTAGLAVASRLVESGRATVAVIEAGDWRQNDEMIDLPSKFGQAVGNSTYDWNFQSTPQTYLAGQSIHLARGKVLGGSSAINYLGWLRASEKEYDAWETLGNPGWKWDNLLQFFRKSENVTRPGTVDRFPGVTATDSQFNPGFQGEATICHGDSRVIFSRPIEKFIRYPMLESAIHLAFGSPS